MKPKNTPQSIVAAIQAAHDSFGTISGGYWLDAAPEYFLTTQIGAQISQERNIFCTFEEPLRSFNLGRGRRNYRLRFNGKADIALWSPDEEPIGIIEVKKEVYYTSCQKDLHRLAQFTSKANGAWHASLAYYYISAHADRELCAGYLNRTDTALTRLVAEVATEHGIKSEVASHTSPLLLEDDFHYGFLAHATTLWR